MALDYKVHRGLYKRGSLGTPELYSDKVLNIGVKATQTAAGQVDGNGIPLTSTRKSALEVTGDTGSTDLSGNYYVSAIRGNVVLGTSSTNASIIGILGTLNTNTARFGSGDHYAVRGHLDFWGDSTLGGANNNTGAVSAYVENEATTVVGAGNFLCGLCSYQVGAPTVNIGGYNPALWVRANTSAAAWQYGLYIPTASAKTPIQIGDSSSSSQIGHHLISSNPICVSVCTDDNNTTLGSEVYMGIRSRTMLFKDAAGCTIVSNRGHLKAADGVDFATGVYTPIQGYIELIGDTTISSGGKFWGIDSCIEVNTSKTFTVASGGITGGFHAELTGAGSVSATGVMAGLYVDSSAATAVWPYGIYIGASDCTTGMYVGTSTYGIAMAGNYTNGIIFTGQTIFTAANRSSSYFGIGSYDAHITVNRASQNESSRTYLMQLFCDFAADTAATSDYAMGFYPRFNITTGNQTKSSYAVLSPTIDVDYNVKNAYALKAELDASTSTFTAVTNNLFAVSGFLDLGSGTKNFNCAGSLGAAAGIFGFSGGANVTLQSSSRTFALIAHTYSGASATATMLINAGGTVTDSALLVDEYEVTSCPIGIHISAGTKGLTIDHNTTTAISIGSSTLTNVLDFTGCSTSAVPEDNLAAPNKAGSIAILTPAGAVAWVNFYDGTRA